ncbi:MAG: hypothetical protein ACRDOU_26490, partial [Streptosporangiaceae bacterium]
MAIASARGWAGSSVMTRPPWKTSDGAIWRGTGVLLTGLARGQVWNGSCIRCLEHVRDGGPGDVPEFCL